MMWKPILILILATCVFGNISPSETENGDPEDSFDDGAINTSPGIRPSDRSVYVLIETTPMPRPDSQIRSDRGVSEMLGLKPEEMVPNITLQGQQESSTQNEQGNYPHLNETKKGTAIGNTGFTENISSNSENSTNIQERNENADSEITSKQWNSDASKYLTTDSYFLGRSASIVTSTLSLHAASGESLATGIENISHENNSSVEKDEKPVSSARDATSENSDGEIDVTTEVFKRSTENIDSTTGLHQAFTVEENSVFPISTTTDKKFYSSRSSLDMSGFKSFISEDDDFTGSSHRISKVEFSSGRDEPVTGISYVYPSATTPFKISETISEDTVHGTIPEQDFTEESISLSAFSTGEDVSFSSELSSFDAKEINPIQPAVNESSWISSGGNTENNTFEYSHGADNTTHVTEVSEESLLEKNSTTPTPFFSYYDEIPPLSEVNNPDVTAPYSGQNVESTSNVSYSNDTKLTSFDLPGDSELPPSKQLPNNTYKIIFTGKCFGDNMLPQTFKTLYSIMNTGLNAENSTKLIECKQVYDFKFTSNIASPESLKDVLDQIKEKLSPVHAKIVNYDDSEIYEISHTSEEYSENFIIPKMMVYISTSATIVLILFLISVVLFVRNKCKRSSTSIDLSDMPHLTLSLDDYKLSPIPRPSVSIRDNNRDFLYAYSNETYSRTREDDPVLAENPFSKSAGQELLTAVKTQKDNPLALEMHTFEAKRGTNRLKSEKDSHSAKEYSTPNSWLGLNGRKRGVEHPAIRW